MLLKPVLPIELEELEIFGKCGSTIWAVIRYRDCGEIKEKQPKFDIDLCDEQGTIWVRMKGYMVRVLESAAGLAETSATGILMLKTNRQEQPAVPGTSSACLCPAPGNLL